jgi:hypothetical protein
MCHLPQKICFTLFTGNVREQCSLLLALCTINGLWSAVGFFFLSFLPFFLPVSLFLFLFLPLPSPPPYLLLTLPPSLSPSFPSLSFLPALQYWGLNSESHTSIVLYHLSHVSNSFVFSWFLDRITQ